MAIEYYDESMGKPIEKMEETMILDDNTSYFLVSLEQLTRKINLINLIKAMSGDEESDNSEYKFYTTKFINEKFGEIIFHINNVDGKFDEYNEIIEKLKTKVDITLKKFEVEVEGITPKLEALEDALQKYVDEKCQYVYDEVNTVNLRIDEVYKILKDSDDQIRQEIKDKFDSLSDIITSGDNVTDGLIKSLENTINSVNSRLTNIYNELKNVDVELSKRISALEGKSEDVNNSFNNYYNKTNIDEKINEIYKRIKVQVISSTTDSSGIANNANNYIEDGLYFFTTTSKVTNVPAGSTNGLLHVMDCTGGVIRQVYYRYGTLNKTDHNMYLRMRASNGQWSSWARVLTDKDIIYGTSVPTNLENGQIYIQYFV